MAKKKKDRIEYRSIVDGKKRLMICTNSVPNGPYWKGSLCNTYSEVGLTTLAVTCSRCTMSLCEEPQIGKSYKSSGKPRGWQFMKEYVHDDGTVYYKGKEQPKLKGTLAPTPPPEPKKKMSKHEKERLRQEMFTEFNALRKQFKKEKRITHQRRIQSKINKIERQLKKM